MRFECGGCDDKMSAAGGRHGGKDLKEASVLLDYLEDAVQGVELSIAGEVGDDNSGVALDDEDDTDAETAYVRDVLATRSGFMRCIAHATEEIAHVRVLWRFKGGNEVTVQSIDENRPAQRRLRIKYPESIQSACIDALAIGGQMYIHALGEKSHQLYTVHFKWDVFEGSEVPSQWYEVRPIATFDLVGPHHMRALSGSLAIFALQNGGLLKVDGAEEVMFSDGTYLSTLKGILPSFRSSLPPSVSIDMVGSLEHKLLITMSIDRHIKVWSLDSNTLLKQYSTMSSSAPHLHANPSSFLSLVPLKSNEDHLFYIAAYNPLDEGMFTIWAGAHNGHGLFTELISKSKNELVCRPPDGESFWSVKDFKLCADLFSTRRYDNILNLWVLWKSNTLSVVQYKTFNMDDIQNASRWRSVQATGKTLGPNIAKDRSFLMASDVARAWDFKINRPSRYSTRIKSVALQMYTSRKPTQESISLQIHQAVKEQVAKDAPVLSGLHEADEEDFFTLQATEYARIDRLCAEFERRGEEALSLFVDPDERSVVIAKADRVNVVRTCVAIEATRTSPTVVSILRASRSLYEVIPPDVLEDALFTIDEEIKGNAFLSPHDFMVSFFENHLAEFTEEFRVGEELMEDVKLAENFQEVISYLSAEFSKDETEYDGKLTDFVFAVTYSAVCNVLNLHYSTVQHLLFLTAYIGCAAEDLAIGRAATLCFGQLIQIYLKLDALLLCSREFMSHDSNTTDLAGLTSALTFSSTTFVGESQLQYCLSWFGFPHLSQGFASSTSALQHGVSSILHDTHQIAIQAASHGFRDDRKIAAKSLLQLTAPSAEKAYLEGRIALQLGEHAEAATLLKHTIAWSSSLLNSKGLSPLFISGVPFGSRTCSLLLHLAQLCLTSMALKEAVSFAQQTILIAEKNTAEYHEGVQILFKSAMSAGAFDDAYIALIELSPAK